MRRADIRFGRKYRTRNGYGPAEVLGPERKPPGFSNTVEFLVRYPMAPPGRASEVWVSTRDFLNRWNEADEQAFAVRARQRAEIDALKAGLTSAGFEPERAHYLSWHGANDLYLSFKGDVAERVVTALIGQAKAPAELPAPARELEAGERSD